MMMIIIFQICLPPFFKVDGQDNTKTTNTYSSFRPSFRPCLHTHTHFFPLPVTFRSLLTSGFSSHVFPNSTPYSANLWTVGHSFASLPPLVCQTLSSQTSAGVLSRGWMMMKMTMMMMMMISFLSSTQTNRHTCVCWFRLLSWQSVLMNDLPCFW